MNSVGTLAAVWLDTNLHLKVSAHSASACFDIQVLILLVCYCLVMQLHMQLPT